MPRRIARALPPEHPEFEPLDREADLFASGGYSCVSPGAGSYKGFTSREAPPTPSGADGRRPDLARLYMVGGIVAAVVATIGVGWLTTKPEAPAKRAPATIAAHPAAAPPVATPIEEARLTSPRTPISARKSAVRPRAMRTAPAARSETAVLKLAKPAAAGGVTSILGSDDAAKFTITHAEEPAGSASPQPPAESKPTVEAKPAN